MQLKFLKWVPPEEQKTEDDDDDIDLDTSDLQFKLVAQILNAQQGNLQSFAQESGFVEFVKQRK